MKTETDNENISDMEVSSYIERGNKLFSDLFDMTEERYRRDDSLCTSPELISAYLQHTREVYKFATFFAVSLGLGESEIRLAQVAAILHDLTKADPPPDQITKYNNENAGANIINLYALISHPHTCADKLSGMGYDFWQPIAESAKVSVDDAKAKITSAIKVHSGPIPGFMQRQIKCYTRLRGKQGELPDIPEVKPDPEDATTMILIMADMAGLCTQVGVEKIEQIRLGPLNKINSRMAEAVGLSEGLTAKMSAFMSGREGIEMIKNLEGKGNWDNTVSCAMEDMWEETLMGQKKEDRAFINAAFCETI